MKPRISYTDTSNEKLTRDQADLQARDIRRYELSQASIINSNSLGARALAYEAANTTPTPVPQPEVPQEVVTDNTAKLPVVLSLDPELIRVQIAQEFRGKG